MVLNASFNELVFENRHKNYGAYQIRKRYSRNVLLAAFFAVTLFSMALGTYFINMPESQAGVPPIQPKMDTSLVILKVDPNQKKADDKQKEKEKPQPPKGSTNTITSNIAIADSVPTTVSNDSVGTPKGIVGGIGNPLDTATNTGNPCTNCDDTIPKVTKLVKWMLTPPKDPGLDAFFVKNIKYPQAAREQNIEGTVYLTFIVDTKGDVRDIKIAKGIHPLLDREVLRVAKFMPKWEPVKDETGEIVEYQYNKPVRFKLK